jgi:hypothetical protein
MHERKEQIIGRYFPHLVILVEEEWTISAPLVNTVLKIHISIVLRNRRTSQVVADGKHLRKPLYIQYQVHTRRVSMAHDYSPPALSSRMKTQLESLVTRCGSYVRFRMGKKRCLRGNCAAHSAPTNLSLLPTYPQLLEPFQVCSFYVRSMFPIRLITYQSSALVAFLNHILLGLQFSQMRAPCTLSRLS